MVAMNSIDKLWPKAASDVVFLLDYSTKTERKILEKIIGDQSADRAYQWLPLTTGSGKKMRANIEAIAASFNDNKRRYYVPLRVSWYQAADFSSDITSLKDVMFRFGRPNAWMQKIAHRNDPSAYHVVVGKSASLGELQQRLVKTKAQTDLSRFIARAAFLALDRAERSFRGSGYRIPRMISDEVLTRPRVREALEQAAEAEGSSYEALRRRAKSYLKEMAATPTSAGIDMVAGLGRFMYTRGFDKTIDLLPEDVERVRALLSERPVAFLFTHKSHIDGFLLVTLFRDYDLPPLHTFSGINMGFLGLGSLLRNAGAIFIRRSFKDDEVYKLVFKNYIDYLGEKRFPLLWALEGTRSRTGKLMPPRYGLMNYVVDAYMRDDAADLVLLPISIVYDQVPEIGDYDAIQAGGNKKPETASWFMRYLSGLNIPHGKLHVRFGKGVQLSDYIDSTEATPKVGRRDVQKMAFDIAVDANNATPVTVNSLICYVMLAHGHRAVTFDELESEIDGLRSFIEQFEFPVTDDVVALDGKSLQISLGQLAATGVISIAEDGLEAVYMIPHDKGRKAAYYRNGLIHFFITSAIGEVALLAVTETGAKALAQFHSEALRIRDLLKYEFFFEGSEAFITLLESEFDRRMPGWREALAQGKEATQLMLVSMPALLGHGTLRPFLEAYLVFSRALVMSPVDAVIETKPLIEKALSLGKQRVLQQRIHCEESVSRSYFENAVKIAEARGLLDHSEAAVAGRQLMWQDFKDITANIRFLASIMEARRLARL